MTHSRAVRSRGRIPVSANAAWRTAIVIKDGTIEYVFYPVFSPEQNASGVIAWLEPNR